MSYNEEVWIEKHKQIESTLNSHEAKFDKQDKRLDELEKDSREYKVEIKNLIKKMDDFMTTIRWGLGIFVTVSIFVIGIILKR